MNKIIGIILASGGGVRFGSTVPKQFMSLNGKMVIEYVIDNMKASGIFKDIYVVSDENFEKYYSKLKDIHTIIFPSGTRVSNMHVALNHIGRVDKDIDYVIFQDSVRPFTTPEHYKKLYNSLSKKTSYDFLITTQPITDVLFKDEITHILPMDRKQYELGQCPEIIKWKSLGKFDSKVVDECASLAEYASKSGLIGGGFHYEGNNLKITYNYDLFQAEQLLRFSIPKIENNPDLQGKRILLFGGSGDIGTSVKEYCENRGAIVYSPSREALMDLYHNVHFLNEKYDCIINCIGAYCTNDNQSEKFQDVLNANIEIPIVLIKYAETHWLSNGGSIVMLGSTAGLAGRKGIGHYGATKAYLHNYAESYAHDLKKKNIKINIVAPAKVVGKLQKSINPDADTSQMINPNNLARIICSYINTEETGKIIVVPVGLENKNG